MWTCPPKRILVPVDFGEASGRAADAAALLVAQVGAAAQLLHAEHLEAPPYFTHEQIGAIEGQRQAARQKAAEFLAEFGRRHGLASAEVALVEGNPVDAVLSAARSVDLVIMGTHGRRGATRWLMGSVAERVVHESQAPVLVVRADGAAPTAASLFARPLLISQASEGDIALRVARGLAQAFGGEVVTQSAECRTDQADAQGAGLVVVSKAVARPAFFAHPVEQWLRTCHLPMLFVPADAIVA